jgi:hypothetical protein
VHRELNLENIEDIAKELFTKQEYNRLLELQNALKFSQGKLIQDPKVQNLVRCFFNLHKQEQLELFLL